jgi:hypothetical protein
VTSSKGPKKTTVTMKPAGLAKPIEAQLILGATVRFGGDVFPEGMRISSLTIENGLSEARANKIIARGEARVVGPDYPEVKRDIPGDHK